MKNPENEEKELKTPFVYGGYFYYNRTRLDSIILKVSDKNLYEESRIYYKRKYGELLQERRIDQ